MAVLEIKPSEIVSPLGPIPKPGDIRGWIAYRAKQAKAAKLAPVVKIAAPKPKRKVLPPVKQQPALPPPLTPAERMAAVISRCASFDDEYPPVSLIIDLTAAYFLVGKLDIVSARRTATVMRPRHIAMYLAREMTPLSFPKIGEFFGGRDHTTLISAWRRIGWRMECDPDLRVQVEAIRAEIEKSVPTKKTGRIA